MRCANSVTPLLVLVCLLAGCGRPQPMKAMQVYDDPVAYCQAVKTADEPGQTYRGPAVPDWMYTAMHRAKTDSGYIAWRCEDGVVLACENGGITGPCDKRDTSRHPLQPMLDWCREHPGDSDIPAAASGHYTVYAWYCEGGEPQIRRQFSFPDQRGFMPDEWVRIEKGSP